MRVHYKGLFLQSVSEVQRAVSNLGTKDESALVNFFLDIIDALELELEWQAEEMHKMEKRYEG